MAWARHRKKRKLFAKNSVTFEEFEHLPDATLRQELRHGKLCDVPPQLFGRFRIQSRIRNLFDNAAEDAGEAVTGFGFKIPQYDYWIAHVAFITNERWARETEYFEGAPEIVVDVPPSSGSALEARHKRKICLKHGALEFWTIDDEHREVEVSTPDGRSIIYKSGQQVPLFFSPETLAVDQIFEGPKETA